MKYYYAFLFLVFTFAAQSQNFIEPCKYGQPLVVALQAQYSPVATLGYSNARDTLYSQIDNDGLDLACVYTEFKVQLSPGSDPSSTVYQGGQGLNAEHVYPQSKGAGSEPMRSDMFNIFPCKVNVNSDRGNCPFNEIDDTDTDVWYYQSTQSSAIPLVDIFRYSEKDNEDCQFEPREEVKGDIARAVFYFYTIYQSTANSADPNFFHIQKNTLFQWHLQDLPDAKELRRDSLIELYQGNNNPFIRDTSLVRRAYFMADASYLSGDDNCYDVLTPTTEIVADNWVEIPLTAVEDRLLIKSKYQDGRVAVVDVNGRIALESRLSNQVIAVSTLPSGIYFVVVYSRGKFFSKKIMKY